MKNLVICGTSGVGKTFLEEYLENHGLAWQLPKYFDRENRPGERIDKNISVDGEEWIKLKDDFFFTLSYNGHNYGWKRQDVLKNNRVTLAITLDSLEDFLRANNNFLPILLWVEENNFGLLEKRMRDRGEKEEKIKQRLELAKSELKNGEKYKKIVMDNKGWVVIIKNDITVFEELIPKIKAMI